MQGNTTSIALLRGDITKVTADVIVNAANSSLLGGGGVDGAIHRAGGKEILNECMMIRRKQGGCETGQAVITTAGRLYAKYVIHTVGSVWDAGHKGEEQLLANCYRNSLALALQHEARTVAFPNISTGIYKYPKAQAARIAITEVLNFMAKTNAEMRVLFVCFDKENFNVYRDLFNTKQSS